VRLKIAALLKRKGHFWIPGAAEKQPVFGRAVPNVGKAVSQFGLLFFKIVLKYVGAKVYSNGFELLPTVNLPIGR